MQSHAPPMFFETIHVLAEPTDATKCPPGQALFLAAGQALFGHPWHRVWKGNSIEWAGAS